MRRKSFGRDKRAATAVIFATAVVPLLATAGLALDVGNIFGAKRRLQGANDLAAIAAATDIAHANAAAGANASANGYQPGEITRVELGTYTPDPSIPVASRFETGTGLAPNAVRVSMTHPQPLFFAPVFNMAGGTSPPVKNVQPIATQAIAAVQNTAEFAIGSRVASLNGGIVNGVLGALVGGNVSLSALDYNNLLSTNVDMFGLAQAIALHAGQVSGTYKQALSGTITLPQFLSALGQVAPGASTALFALQNAAAPNSVVDLAKLVEFGPYGNLLLSEPEPHITATASVLNLIQAAAEVGGEAHLINLSIGATLPGIASVTGLLSIGEPAQHSTVIAIDAVGSSVHTAQIRLFLDVSLLGTGTVSAVNLPLYLEVGYGTAQLAGLSCNALDATTTTVTLNVTPGLVNGWIGNVTPADMTNYTAEPTVTPATFVNLGLVTVTGQANATVGNQSPEPVAFSYADIQNHVVKTSNTTDFTGALFASLLGRTNFQVNGTGVPGLPAAVSGVIAGASAPVDQLINGVLQTLGVGLGEADTWVGGARCGAAVLAG